MRTNPQRKKGHLFWMAAASLLAAIAGGQQPPGEASVHFENRLRPWDGFGVNYVESCQTRDYRATPQDYGGFHTLSQEKRERILDLTFGSDGLKPGLVKMFLDPFHEGMTRPQGNGPSRFDHETTTKWLRYFVREGLQRTRARGADLQIVTTMYGPPPWTTKQKFMRGRDLDPAEKQEVAQYMISWVKYLRDAEKFPVKYVSLHNEGEGFNRWPADGGTGGTPNNDYNMWWPSSQVVDFLRFMRPMMDREGLQDVGLTPGETSNWETFGRWYAYFIQTDPVALKNLGLITSHGFGLSPQANNSLGVDVLRLAKPELHAWTTSMSFGKMDVSFVEMVRQNIYASKVNALIPWAYIQTDDWTGGDPNPGTAFWVDGKGDYTIEEGYYLLKQLSRAGQPGMAVADVATSDPNIQLMAFASNGTANPDAFIVFNLSERVRPGVRIRVSGTEAKSFDAYVTGFRKKYESLGAVPVQNGALECAVPPQAVITFFAKR